jgi:hypothetical protein
MTTQHVTLYHQGKNGAIYSWKIRVDGASIKTEYGQVDGAKTHASKNAEPKNGGRANATTAEQQAVKEAAAMWQHRIDRKYFKPPDEAKEELFLPRLAQDFAKHGEKRAVYPCDVQPKLVACRRVTISMSSTSFMHALPTYAD